MGEYFTQLISSKECLKCQQHLQMPFVIRTLRISVPGVESPAMILGNSINTLKTAAQATPCFLTLPLGVNMPGAGVIPVTTGLTVQPSIHHVPVQQVSSHIFISQDYPQHVNQYDFNFSFTHQPVYEMDIPHLLLPYIQHLIQ